MSFYTDLVDAALPQRPLEIGEVIVVDADAGICTVQLPGGGVLQVRGSAALGATVFVRDGAIEGTTSDGLPLITYEI